MLNRFATSASSSGKTGDHQTETVDGRQNRFMRSNGQAGRSGDIHSLAEKTAGDSRKSSVSVRSSYRVSTPVAAPVVTATSSSLLPLAQSQTTPRTEEVEEKTETETLLQEEVLRKEVSDFVKTQVLKQKAVEQEKKTTKKGPFRFKIPLKASHWGLPRVHKR